MSDRVPMTREQYNERVKQEEARFEEKIKNYEDWLVVSSAIYNFTNKKHQWLQREEAEYMKTNTLNVRTCLCPSC